MCSSGILVNSASDNSTYVRGADEDDSSDWCDPHPPFWMEAPAILDLKNIARERY